MPLEAWEERVGRVHDLWMFCPMLSECQGQQVARDDRRISRRGRECREGYVPMSYVSCPYEETTVQVDRGVVERPLSPMSGVWD